MGILSLNRIHRLFLAVWTVSVAAVAFRAPDVIPVSAVPTPGPLAGLADLQVQYGILAVLWISVFVLVLAWQRTLWTTMGEGARFDAGGTVGLRLPVMRASVRDHTVSARAVRRGWSPFVRLRVETSIDVRDPPVALELAVATEADPDGRVLFEAPDADRRYVLRDGAGDLAAVLSTDYRANLAEVDAPGVLRVEGRHASYELSRLPFDAGRLRSCAEATVDLAERVERAADDRRGS
jgi:hypothetical protein